MFNDIADDIEKTAEDMAKGAVVGAAIGATTGGEGGAAVGTVVEPGGGTVVGAAGGALIGSVVGAFVGMGKALITDVTTMFSSSDAGSQGTPRQAQVKNGRGQGPREIKRVDEPHDYPGAQWHAHGKNGGAINQDGTIHDADPDFGRKTLNWLRGYGWNV